MPERRHHTAVLILLAIVAMGSGILFLCSGGDRPVPFPALPGDTAGEAPADDQPVATRATAVEAPIEPKVIGAARSTGPIGIAPDAGVLDVRITQSASTVGKTEGGVLFVEELFNENTAELKPDRRPWRKETTFRFDPMRSPTFAVIDGVPFSAYGYRVWVWVPGFNGSSQTVRVTEDSWNPQVDLMVSAGSPLQLRLIDQRFEPYPHTDLMLVPTGEVRGRDVIRAQTDNFGTAAFASVLAGEYAVHVGGLARATILVARTGFVHDELGSGRQSQNVVIERGAKLRVEVFDAAGRGMPGVTVRVMAIDTVENIRQEHETDATGVWEFEHVLPGRYQVDAMAQGHPTVTKPRVAIEAGVDPAPIRLRMRR